MKKKLLLLAFIFICFNVFGQTTTDSAANPQPDSTHLYGLVPQLPIKVGGGPAEQRYYCEWLRDAQGKKVKYERKGSCCPYSSKSPRAFGGIAMVDIYEISYKDENNKKQKISIYISFYDYETPRPIKGFTFMK